MKDKIEHIVNWIKNYAKQNNFGTLVVGVSGGIDSAVTSTLCAMTGLRTMPIVMSIRNKDIFYIITITSISYHYNIRVCWVYSNI